MNVQGNISNSLFGLFIAFEMEQIVSAFQDFDGYFGIHRLHSNPQAQ